MEKKKSKKGLIAIATLLVILILVIAIIIYIVIGGNNNTGTAWGDTYYAYLKNGLEETNEDERQKYGLQTGVEKAEIQFVETNEEEEPVMLMSYDKDDESYINIYYINDQNSVSSILNQEYSDAEYLYNINNKEYSWYLHSESDSTDSYKDISKIINNQNQSEPEYVLDKNNKTEVKLEDGNSVELSEFDKTFIKPEIEDNSKQEISIIDYVANDIIEKINSLVSSYDRESDKINEEVQSKVDELAQVAEEAEQESGVIQAGNYTLQYGSYVDKYGTEYILNSDGTATCTSTELASRNLENGKFVVYNYNDYANEIDAWEKENGPIGFSGEWMIAIGENVDESKPYLTYSYSISDNNEFYNGQTDEIWTYQENNNTQEDTQTESSTFKVGNYTLHYGTYSGTGTMVIENDSGSMETLKYTYTITLNSDGTYSIKSSNEEAAESRSGEYTVGTTSGMNGIIFDDLNNDGILEGNAMFLAVYADDTLSQPAGAEANYKYQGD